MKDNFSKQAELYAKYRPAYPQELINHILSFVTEKNAAWDCGTGNGQTAFTLSRYFKQVIATDISGKQLGMAPQADNIIYKNEAAEKTSLANNSINLVTVSQALHWFRFDEFYQEVRRVAAPGAVIAVWTYSLLQVSPAIDALISHYHFHTLGSYWDAERKYVDDGYQTVPFPFRQIECPSFRIEVNWTTEDLKGYFHTWSALQKYLDTNPIDPVDALMEEILPLWGDEPVRKIFFPIHLKMGKIDE